jgi:hypothetical protein
MARVKGFADWNPQRKTRGLLADIDVVLDEYRAYLPLTIRQIFYRLVGKGYPKTENFYATVQEVTNRARRSGRLPFPYIRDDGVSRRGGERLTYGTPREYYKIHETIHNFYRRSWHDDQPTFVRLLSEASGMVPMLERAVSRYRIGVASSSGFDSLTVKHDLFTDALERYESHGQKTVLLHVGDHDPSGVSIHESMAEDLAAFCEDSSEARTQEEIIELRRVALMPEQIRRFRIETTPDDIKPTVSRSKAFLARGLDPAAQLEAIRPEDLTQIVRQAVEDALDLNVLRASRERENQERDEVGKKLDDVNRYLREAFGLEDEDDDDHVDDDDDDEDQE